MIFQRNSPYSAGLEAITPSGLDAPRSRSQGECVLAAAARKPLEPDRKRRLAAFGSLTALFMAVFVVCNPRVVATTVFIFGEAAPGELRYDTGYGFNDAQPLAVPPGSRSETAVLACPRGENELVILLDIEHDGRIEGLHGALQIVDAEARAAVACRMDRASTLAAIEIGSLQSLKRVGIASDGALVEWSALQTPAARGVVAIVRESDRLLLAWSTAGAELPLGPVRELGLVSPADPPPAGNPRFAVRVSRHAASLLPLAAVPSHGLLLTSGRLDDAPFRDYTSPIRWGVKIVIALVLAAICLSVCRWVRSGMMGAGFARNVRAAWLRWQPFPTLFSLLLLYFSMWTLGQWPGFVGWDSPSAIEQHYGGVTNSWYSWVYPLFVTGLMELGGRYTNLIVFQTVATAAMGAAVLSSLSHRGLPRWSVWMIALLFGGSPIICAYNSFYCRDVLNGLLMCSTLYFAFRLYSDARYSGREPGCKSLVLLGSLLVLMGLLRRENVVVALCLLASMSFFATGLRKGAVVTAAVLSSIFLGNGPIEKWVTGTSNDPNNQYARSALINPAGALISQRYWTRTPDADREVVNRILDFEVFKSEWDPYSIGYWQNRSANRRYTNQEIRAFRNFMVRAAIDNPQIMLGARTQTFASLLGSPKTWFLSDFSREKMREAKLRDLGIWREAPTVARLQRAQSKLIWKSIEENWFIWRAHPQLLAVVLVFLLYPWCPVAAATCAAVLARMGALFACAPASHFFYVYDLYLFGIFVIPMGIVEWRMARSWKRGGTVCLSSAPRP